MARCAGDVSIRCAELALDASSARNLASFVLPVASVDCRKDGSVWSSLTAYMSESTRTARKVQMKRMAEIGSWSRLGCASSPTTRRSAFLGTTSRSSRTG